MRVWHELTRGDRHGPLPALLLALTVATGLVDAVSVLALDRVFVANMTGNVVFVAFALAGVAGFSLLASVVALLGFLAGAFFGGRVGRAHAHRGHLLRDVALIELGLVAAALLLSVFTDALVGQAALLAIAMGLQNSTARRLAVPDLTTTVLTSTMSGLAAEIRRQGRVAAARRALAVATMFLGALIGAVLVQHSSPAWALAAAAVLIGLVAVVSALRSRGDAPWHAVVTS
ncbi:YoaK family protein [Kutzneria sp. 744]|uniref:YoaK family protein n=1 Tax=Kutzneria sp. (strain 744) TaxID=345341 RepID=UPI0003EEC45B|nr:YoaK family protein [Kutzneria sp. 744]EWM11314.1 membrane protein [Kutzneria sp. 744]